MTDNIGNYALHAAIWDWGGYDRTEEHEYWSNYAKEYGRSILIPMCALGETGAYMAERGFMVTAFDITDEMVEEGKKRFGNVQNLSLMQGDIRNFCFEIPPVDFVFIKDLGHLQSIDDVKSAFAHINFHLRDGGALVLEIGLPGQESSCHPPQTFYPLKQVYPGLKVWKVGETHNDAELKRTYISQTVYIEDVNGTVETFDHSFYLQWYGRDELISALRECGFEIRHEYKNQDKEPWSEGNEFWIAEAVKSVTAKTLYSSAVTVDYLQTPALRYDDVVLLNDFISLENFNRGYIPSFQFDIFVGNEKVGTISVKIGYSIRYHYSGQIGYEIKEEFRGHGYATRACLAVIPFLRKYGYRRILLTADEQNAASRRVCEKIGAILIETVDTPTWSNLYRQGQRRTCRYEWNIENVKVGKENE